MQRRVETSRGGFRRAMEPRRRARGFARAAPQDHPAQPERCRGGCRPWGCRPGGCRGCDVVRDVPILRVDRRQTERGPRERRRVALAASEHVGFARPVRDGGRGGGRVGAVHHRGSRRARGGGVARVHGRRGRDTGHGGSLRGYAAGVFRRSRRDIDDLRRRRRGLDRVEDAQPNLGPRAVRLSPRARHRRGHERLPLRPGLPSRPRGSLPDVGSDRRRLLGGAATSVEGFRQGQGQGQ